MDELSPEQLAELRSALLSLRESLMASLADTTRQATVELDQTAVGRISRVDALQQQAMAQAERRIQARRLEAVQAALELKSAQRADWKVNPIGPFFVAGDQRLP